MSATIVFYGGTKNQHTRERMMKAWVLPLVVLLYVVVALVTAFLGRMLPFHVEGKTTHTARLVFLIAWIIMFVLLAAMSFGYVSCSTSSSSNPPHRSRSGTPTPLPPHRSRRGTYIPPRFSPTMDSISAMRAQNLSPTRSQQYGPPPPPSQYGRSQQYAPYAQTPNVGQYDRVPAEGATPAGQYGNVSVSPPPKSESIYSNVGLLPYDYTPHY